MSFSEAFFVCRVFSNSYLHLESFFHLFRFLRLVSEHFHQGVGCAEDKKKIDLDACLQEKRGLPTLLFPSTVSEKATRFTVLNYPCIEFCRGDPIFLIF